MSDHVVDFLPELELGALDPEARSRVEAHLAACVSCARERVALRETLAKVSFDLAPAPAPRRLRDLVVGAVAAKPSYEGFVRRFVRLFDISADQAREILRALDDESTWEPYIPGVTLYHFHAGPRTNGADAGLVRFRAGMKYPRHTHVGDEYMLILAGSLRDDVTGEWVRVGDTVHMGPGTAHSFVIGPDEDCVSAVLLEGGLPIIDETAALDENAGRDDQAGATPTRMR